MTNRSLGRFVLLTVSLLLVLLGSGSAFAQGTSHINGTVTDPQGNVVPGATATLKDSSKNFSRSQTTSDSGHFSFSLIPPGTYQLTGERRVSRKLS